MFDAVTQMGLREVGAVSATVIRTKLKLQTTWSRRPQSHLRASIFPLTRASRDHGSLAVPASGGMDRLLERHRWRAGSAIHLSGWTY